ncbi:MAG: cysteine desulfurase family protein [Nocardioidaceae bacterium]
MSDATTPVPRVAYLDHAATTPVYPEVITAVAEQLARPGNASSLHGSGRAARRVVEESRETIAAALNARPSEVVFTSGGTESDNLATKGLFWARHKQDDRRVRVLSSAIEHHAVLDSLRWLASEAGAEVELLPVDSHGRLDVDALAESVARDPQSVAMVSVMLANNEVGTLQPLDAVVEIAAAQGIPVHTDAVQVMSQLPLDFAATGVDAMTVTGHKIGGPLGVGALVLRREVELVALLHGGGQERDVRSGTIDSPAIVGLAVAAELAVKGRCERGVYLAGLRDDLIRRVTDVVPDAELNGPVGDGRLPGNAHLSFPGCEGDSLLMLLDAQGIECSTGSACSAGVPQASHVLLAMGRDEATARGSLRFSLGHTSTQHDIDRVVQAIGPAVERARAAGVTGVAAGGRA